MPHTRFNRRHFVKSAVALGASGFLSRNAFSKTSPSYPLKGRLYKTLKINMIRIEASLTEKFRAAKAAGFMGVEMNSPGMDVAETRAAIAASGLPVDGTVCSTHWKIRHSSPDATVRAQASEDLKTAIRDTHAVGGHTVLLVVGKGEDGPESEIWPRSVENIKKSPSSRSGIGRIHCDRECLESVPLQS